MRFARGRHVRDAAAHLGQAFQLALVGVVESFPGVIRWLEHGFQRDHQRRAEALARVEQRQHRLADQAGQLRFVAPEAGEPVADLAVHPELVAHDQTSLA